MPDSDSYLAVDLGASSGRVIAGSLDGGRLQLETVHRFANAPVFVQDSMQWDTLGLWREIQTGLKQANDRAAASGARIRSVGVDTWGVDYVLLGADDQPVAPIYHYRDQRNDGMLEKAFEILPREQIFQRTGLQFMQINSLYQLLATKQNSPQRLEAAESFVMMADYFHWLLTGERSVEATNASTTQLLDPRSGDWSESLIESMGLPRRIFGPLSQPGTTLAPLQSSVGDRTGLGNIPVILPATHDTASAVLAVPSQGFAPEKPDWCYISSGTWSLMGCELPGPLVNERCAELNFTNEGGVRGSTRLLKNIGGLWVFQQIRAALERRGQAVSWEDMVSQAQGAPAFELLVDPDHPEFLAPADMVDAICGYAGRSGQRVPADNGVLYRAALEGLALRYRICLEMLESLVDSRIRTIHVVGGGAMNRLLCQMTADACRRTVVAGPVEATATGNILMQMIGSGELHSVDEARALVRRSSQPVTYEPQDPDPWDAAAERFVALP